MQQPTRTLSTAIEAHRLRLEESLAKLRKALDNWRIYSFEYEAFREELQALPAGASHEAMLNAGLELEGQLVDEREIRSLLGEKVGVKRDRDQVITAVSHRIEYVDENVKKVQKQVDATEEKINQLFIISAPEAKTEEGLSVMDIQEELDENGNVMNAWVNGKDPEATSRTLDPTELLKLEKLVGETEIEEEKDDGAIKTSVGIPETNVTPAKASPQKEPQPTPIEEVDSDTEDKEEEGGGYVRILDDPEEPKPEEWVQEVPGETEEETRLRKEMLSYNMQEIGAVVAELNLEEDGDYYGYEDYSDEDFDEEDDDDTEDEDKWGRTTRRVVSESYRRQMEELEQRLTGKIPAHVQAKEKPAKSANGKPDGRKGVRFAEELDIAPAAPKPAALPKTAAVPADQINIAPDDNDAIPFLEKLLERQEIANAGPIPLSTPNQTTVKKPKPKVSLFKRDKIPAPSPLRQVATPPEPIKEPVKEAVISSSVVSDSVMERSSNTPVVPIQPPSLPVKKMSRFKAARMANSAEDEPKPEAPQAIMSNFVVEREPTTSEANPPDEMDPALHRQEVAMQYHKLRSKMIHQQGGFTESDEDRAIVPLDEASRPKISRFKAARLKGLGP
ncbi:hypothetical protein K440DRAFT_590357 [Wilcoxina mikolae CBS 423.85]|nr:hypothetical protein K440DRAFT_590357 [Wilcoxina mikolae CBS 423.85]